MILYFSATGNSKHVASMLAAALGDQAVSIEKCPSSIEVNATECLGLVSPTAWWELPIFTRDFIASLNVIGKPSYVFFVATYGTIPGAIATDAEKELRKRGVRLDAAFGVQMPDTWTPMFDLSNKEKVAAINKAADREIELLIPRVAAREKGMRMPKRLPYAFKPLTNLLLDFERHTARFHLEDTCVGCGLCARNCPSQAIEIIESRAKWTKEMCALCFRCIHSCPTFAIQYGRHTKKHGQYLHPKNSGMQ